MELSKKQIAGATKILNSLSDTQLVSDATMLRVLVVLGVQEPSELALFSYEILTHEIYMRGLKL